MSTGKASGSGILGYKVGEAAPGGPFTVNEEARNADDLGISSYIVVFKMSG